MDKLLILNNLSVERLLFTDKIHLMGQVACQILGRLRDFTSFVDIW